jgi:hypothetical protein
MARVSQISMPSCSSRGTRTDGERRSSSARLVGSSMGTVCSSKSRPDILVINQPRKDQDE